MSTERATAIAAYHAALKAFINAQVAFSIEVFTGVGADLSSRDDRITALEAAELDLEGAEQALERHAH